MLPADVEIVGIASVEFDAECGMLWVRVALSDGSIGAAWWGADDLKRFMGIVKPATHRPIGAALQ